MIERLQGSLATLAEKAFDDDLSVEEASSFLSTIDASRFPKLAAVAHLVVHFVTDADVRAKDSEYDLAMRKEIRDMLRRLEA